MFYFESNVQTIIFLFDETKIKDFYIKICRYYLLLSILLSIVLNADMF